MGTSHISATARDNGSATAVRARRCVLLAVAACLLALAAAPPASAASLEKAFWGPTQVDGVSQFPIYDDLGVTIFQLAVRWSDVAPTRPQNARDPLDPAYRWPDDVDFAIGEAKRHGMKVLLQLINAPRWANSGRAPEYAPDRPSDYGAFARAAARRYPSVRHWMIWGEPSRSAHFKPLVRQPLGTKITTAQKRAPRRYARLLDEAYGQLKAQRRSNIIIGGNTYVTGEVRPGDWMRAMKLPNGRPPRMTYYGHNPFGYRNPDLRNPPSKRGLVDFSDLGRFDKELQRDLGKPLGKRIKLFLSEYTVATAPDIEFNFWVSLTTQAEWITSAFRVARQLENVVALGWVHLYDDQPITGRQVINGGLIGADGKPKPGYYAFQRGG